MLLNITLKPDAELKKQEITKKPTHYKERIKKTPDEFETNGTFERIGLKTARKNELTSAFNNPFILLLKSDSFKIVFWRQTTQFTNWCIQTPFSYINSSNFYIEKWQ